MMEYYHFNTLMEDRVVMYPIVFILTTALQEAIYSSAFYLYAK